MGKFEKLYGTAKDRFHFRNDIRDESKPNAAELGWLVDEEFSKLIEYWDSWEFVPSAVLYGVPELRDFDNRANQYLSDISGLNNIDDARKKKADIEAGRRYLNDRKANLLKFDYLRAFYTLDKEANGFRKFFNVIEETNRRINETQNSLNDQIMAISKAEEGAQKLYFETCDELKKKTTEWNENIVLNVRDALKVVQKAQSDASNEIAGMVSTAKATITTQAIEQQTILNEAKKREEEQEKIIAKKGMSAFANEFSKEAKTARNYSIVALVFAVGILLFIAFHLLPVFLAPEKVAVSDIASAQKGGDENVKIISMITLRVVALGTSLFLLGYFLNERKNFMHVAVANRHRANLCNAYLAIADSRSEVERTKYLDAIMPHVAPLGKTGFVMKEAASDIPVLQLLKNVTDNSKSTKPV